MADKHGRLVRAIVRQAPTLFRAQRLVFDAAGQVVGLEDHVAIGLRVAGPEVRAERTAREAIAGMDLEPRRQRQMRPAREPVHDTKRERARARRIVKERLAHAPVGTLLAICRDQLAVPAGVDHAQPIALEAQRHRHEPIQVGIPLLGMFAELRQRFVDDAVVARRMLTQPLSRPARGRTTTIGQGIVFVIAHHDIRLPRFYHVPGDAQRQPNAWAAIDQVAEKDHPAARMAVHPRLQAIAELLQQHGQRCATAVDIADQVVAIEVVARQCHVTLPTGCSSRAWCDRSRSNCVRVGESGSGVRACDARP